MKTLNMAGAIALILSTTAVSRGAGDWISRFDGKTLDGWEVAAKPQDRGKDFWQVRDGAITADSRGRKDHDYVWLVNKSEYADFEVRLKVRGFRESNGNSGVQVRSRYDEQLLWMNGPQIDVFPPDPWRTGLIYDENRQTRHWIYPSLPSAAIGNEWAPKGWKWKYSDEGDGWNTLRIRCQGTRIQTWLNEVPMADYDGKGVLDDESHRRNNVGTKGHIALQLHIHDDLLIQYKDIEVRTLD